STTHLRAALGFQFALPLALCNDLESIACGNDENLGDRWLLSEVFRKTSRSFLCQSDPFSDFNGGRAMRETCNNNHDRPPNNGRSTYVSSKSETQATPMSVPKAVRRPPQPKMARSTSTKATTTQAA